MIISDQTIGSLLENGELVVNPLLDRSKQLQGSKIDLRLDNVFRILRPEQVKTLNPGRISESSNSPPTIYRDFEIPYDEEFILQPGGFALGQTFEAVQIPGSLVGRLEGRSSIGRMGVLVHATASGIDPGFVGVICLELFNVGTAPVALSPLMRIASLTLERLDQAPETDYQKQDETKYSGADIRVPPKYDRDFERIRDRVTGL